ncbi:MAG: CdaR family protein [Synergistetes bacterium]|nr:CdaR family protein [Synergistota bacterium]MCX8127693.1 CdaR family protein [Synergistota bacterium]MDW8191392.1 CdaR family protein [Synergistota bacterium]
MRGIWNILESKLFLLIVSLMISIIFWYYTVWIEGPQVVERIIEVPVKVKNPPEKILVEYETKSVELNLKGGKNVLGGLTSRDLEAFVDLQGLNPGIYRLQVQALVPPGVHVVRIKPPFLVVSIRELIDREVPVRVLTVGNPAEGFLVNEVKAVPNSVIIRGPKDVVEKVPYVFATLNIGGAVGNIDAVLELRAEGVSENSLSELMIIPSRVRASVSLKPGWPTKIVKVKVDIKGKPNEAFEIVSVEAIPSHITVMGPSSALDKINEIVTPPLDVSELSKTEIFDMTLSAPAELKFVEKPNIRVIVELKERVLEREYFLPVRIHGSSVFLKWRVSPNHVKVKVKGPYTKIMSLNIQDILVLVDVSGVDVKEATLPVSISLPPGLEVISVTPEMVKVSIVKEGG